MSKIFHQQLRAALALGLVGWATFIFLVGEIKPSAVVLGAPEFMDQLLRPFVILFGFALGERCFPSQFKERQFFFLLGTPAKRSSLWATTISARLLACMTCFMLMLGPSGDFFLVQPVAPLTSHLYLLSTHVLFFMLGSFLALLIRKTLLVYLTGFPVGFMVFSAIEALTKYGMTYPKLGHSDLDIDTTLIMGDFLAASLLPLSLCVALFSLRAFISIDIVSLRLRAIKIAESLAAIVLYSTVHLAFCLQPSLAQLVDQWTSVLPADSPERLVSSNGRYLAVVERLRNWPWFSRVNIIDIANGNCIYRKKYSGLIRLSWSKAGTTLNLWRNIRPFLGGKSSIERIGLNPEGSQTALHTFEYAVGFLSLTNGRELVVTGTREFGKAFVIDEETGRIIQTVQVFLKYFANQDQHIETTEWLHKQKWKMLPKSLTPEGLLSLKIFFVSRWGTRRFRLANDGHVDARFWRSDLTPPPPNSVELGLPNCKPDESPDLGLFYHARGFDGFNIQILCSRPGSPSVRIQLFRYSPDSGQVQKLRTIQSSPTKALGVPLYADGQKKVIWLSPDGEVAEISGKGARILWPQTKRSSG